MQLASIKAPGNDRFVGSSIDNTNDEEEGEAEEDDDMDDSGSQGFEQEEDEVEVRDGSFSRTHVLSVVLRYFALTSLNFAVLRAVRVHFRRVDVNRFNVNRLLERLQCQIMARTPASWADVSHRIKDGERRVGFGERSINRHRKCCLPASRRWKSKRLGSVGVF